MRPEWRRPLISLAVVIAFLVLLGSFPALGVLQRAAQGLAALSISAVAILAAWISFLQGGKRSVGGAVAFNSVVFVTLGFCAVIAATPEWPTAIFWAAACLLSGGFIGMLFGVPISAKQANGAPRNLVAESADTVSKFITGFGVAKYQEIFAQFKESAGYLSGSLRCCGNQNSSFAGGLILYFSILGFLAGMLLSHFYKINLAPDDPTTTPGTI